MPLPDKQLMIIPSGHDPDKLDEYRRRIDRFQQRQAAARVHNLETQRRFRVFVWLGFVALAAIAAMSAYVAYSLHQVRGNLVSQLQSAQAAVTVSNERWKDARQALVDNRTALQASEELLAKLRAETRAALLLPVVDRTVRQLRDVEFEDTAEEAAVISRLRDIVQPLILQELAADPNATDARITVRIEALVKSRLSGVLRQVRRERTPK